MGLSASERSVSPHSPKIILYIYVKETFNIKTTSIFSIKTTFHSPKDHFHLDIKTSLAKFVTIFLYIDHPKIDINAELDQRWYL